MIGFLQILIGGIHDALEDGEWDDPYMHAVSFACFGIFSNIAALIGLAAWGIDRITEEKQFHLPPKPLWLFVMILVIIFLLLLKDRIMAEDRIRFTSKLRRRLFLISYYSISYAAVIALFWLVSPA